MVPVATDEPLGQIAPLLKIEEVAALLRRSHWTLRRDIRVGKIRVLRFGRRIFIEPTEVRRLLCTMDSEVEIGQADGGSHP
jgi:excisionase family DNA binding protein